MEDRPGVAVSPKKPPSVPIWCPLRGEAKTVHRQSPEAHSPSRSLSSRTFVDLFGFGRQLPGNEQVGEHRRPF